METRMQICYPKSFLTVRNNLLALISKQHFFFLQADHSKLDAVRDQAKEMEQRADVANRQTIRESYSSLAQKYRDLQDCLLRKLSDMNDLVESWEVKKKK